MDEDDEDEEDREDEEEDEDEDDEDDEDDDEDSGNPPGPGAQAAGPRRRHGGRRLSPSVQSISAEHRSDLRDAKDPADLRSVESLLSLVIPKVAETSAVCTFV